MKHFTPHTKNKRSSTSYLNMIAIFVLWLSAIVFLITFSSCSAPVAQPREVLYRAKLITRVMDSSSSKYVYSSSMDTYIVSIDSAFHSSDTVIWNNERYVLLERSY